MNYWEDREVKISQELLNKSIAETTRELKKLYHKTLLKLKKKIMDLYDDITQKRCK